MRIELSKEILERAVEIIAEIDFLKKEKSPYISLLQDINSTKDLKEELENKGFPEVAIKNIIKKLKALKVINEENDIINIEKGFPEREFGKYKIYFYFNEDATPFSIYYKNIERMSPAVNYQQNSTNIESLASNLVDELNKSSSEIKILKIINNKGIYSKDINRIPLKIIFDDKSNNKNNWICLINNTKKFNIPKIPLKNIFGARWNDSYYSYEENFDDIKDEQNALMHFTKDYEKKSVDINGYGKYNIKLEMVPISPTKNSQRQWFMYLLKKEVQSNNNYYTKEELEQTWGNIFYTTPQINRLGNLEYEYENVLREFKKQDEMHWLIKTAEDLNPFESQENIINKNKIIITNGTDSSLKNAFKQLNLDNTQKITILDRYINTKRHFDSLFEIKKSFPNLTIAFYSTDFYKVNQSEKLEIENLISEYNIRRIVKDKQSIPHARYWKIDNAVYAVSESIDFIKIIDNQKIDFKHTIFTALEVNEIEKQANNLFEGDIENE